MPMVNKAGRWLFPKGDPCNCLWGVRKIHQLAPHFGWFGIVILPGMARCSFQHTPGKAASRMEKNNFGSWIVTLHSTAICLCVSGSTVRQNITVQRHILDRAGHLIMFGKERYRDTDRWMFVLVLVDLLFLCFLFQLGPQTL